MSNPLVEEYKKINPPPPYPNEYHGPHEDEWDDWWRLYSVWVESELLEARENIKRMQETIEGLYMNTKDSE
jgi:hypothetical protein